jgi:hypothetical protein
LKQSPAVPAVPLALTLPVALHRFRVVLPVLAGIIGIPSAPFLLAAPADLMVFGVSVELAAVIFQAALPLAIGSTANRLVRVITGELKDLLAVMTTATHQVAPERDARRPL